jgi:hypothetical protein
MPSKEPVRSQARWLVRSQHGAKPSKEPGRVLSKESAGSQARNGTRNNGKGSVGSFTRSQARSLTRNKGKGLVGSFTRSQASKEQSM